MGRIFNVKLSDDGKSVIILNQTKLPDTIEYKNISDVEEMYNAIKKLEVRGAPAIGVFAGYCVYVLAVGYSGYSKEEFRTKLLSDCDFIESSRPTAVNLKFALSRMKKMISADKEIPEILLDMEKECRAIHNEDIEMSCKISEYGLTLVKEGDGILTHCNAGALAASGYGTGLGTILLGTERGYNFHIYTDETRPLFQGARLTTFELSNAGADVTLICDNMAASLMKDGRINACFVGCDRVASNGDTANKIGTLAVAVLAKHYGIPFYVFCPSSTIDFECRSGSDIVIEHRKGDEIKEMFFKKSIAPKDVKCYNPAFDVTDSEFITAIITEKGICRPPYDKSLYALFGGKL